MVEESGPVQYLEEEEEGDMEDMGYEGDPLLESDYEEGGCGHSVGIMQLCIS